MTFWDLANGRETDLIPIQDPSAVKAVAAPLAGVTAGASIAVGFAFAIATGSISLLPWGMGIYQGFRLASGQADSFHAALSNLEESRRKAARLRIEQAIRYYERALRTKPDNPKVLKRLALSYSAIGDMTRARAAIDRALEATPADHDCWLRKGTYSLATGDLVDAHDAFEKAAECSPDDPECWSNLGLVCQQLGNSEAARLCWDKVILLKPADVSGWINRGELAYAMTNIDEGVRSWKAACSIDPKLIPRWVSVYELGNATFSKGHLEEALARYDEAIYLNPEYAQPWVGKALCEKKAGNLSIALRYFNEALERDGSNANAWFNRGNLLSEMKREMESQSSWRKAYAIDHAVRVPWVTAFDDGSRFLIANQSQQAIPHFLKAVQLFPDFSEAWFKMGVAHRALGQTEGARRCWQRVLELNPLHGLASMNLGNLEFVDGHRERAFELWDQAMTADPKLVQAAINKGAVLADIGELDEAVRLFSKAAAVGHPLGERALNLCKAYAEMDPSVGPVA
jgi:tetratricopeptide (TPR) repeat protein